MLLVPTLEKKGSEIVQRIAEALLIVIAIPALWVGVKIEDFQRWRVYEFPGWRVKALVAKALVVVGQFGALSALISGFRLFFVGKPVEGIAVFGLVVLVECAWINLSLKSQRK